MVGNWTNDLRSNLTKQDVALSSSGENDAFRVSVFRNIDVSKTVQFEHSVYVAECRSWFKVMLPQQAKVVAERSYQGKVGVEFREKSAVDACYKKIHWELVEGVLRELQKAAKNIQAQPKIFYVSVQDLDDKNAAHDDNESLANIIDKMSGWNIKNEFLDLNDGKATWKVVVPSNANISDLITGFKNSIAPLKLANIENGEIAFRGSGEKREPEQSGNEVITEADAVTEEPDTVIEKTTRGGRKNIVATNPKLKTCHPILQAATEYIYQRMDIMVFSCFRTSQEQRKLKAQGRTLLAHGYHNRRPSLAIDIVPLNEGVPDWHDWEAFYQVSALFSERFSGVVQSNKGCYKGFQLGQGINWKHPTDAYHFELIKCVR